MSLEQANIATSMSVEALICDLSSTSAVLPLATARSKQPDGSEHGPELFVSNLIRHWPTPAPVAEIGPHSKIVAQIGRRQGISLRLARIPRAGLPQAECSHRKVHQKIGRDILLESMSRDARDHVRPAVSTIVRDTSFPTLSPPLSLAPSSGLARAAGALRAVESLGTSAALPPNPKPKETIDRSFRFQGLLASTLEGLFDINRHSEVHSMLAVVESLHRQFT